MARRIEFSSAALSDLDEIAYFGAMEFGMSAARRYLQALDDGLKLLLAFPDSAPAYAWSGTRVRIRSIRSHRIVYMVQPGNSLRVLRILHARQLPPELA
ncbi:type II toxin-antitoxin system RelE/ParE family toxin [Glycocaulis abyssi]|uniref:Type II toxin-antitoxin system RelE/ParE family toxin n=1 Tax=Glycocaulis abyssi TaxID=1433403 RepID=A0ABV9NDC2_9PROT